MFLNAGDGKVRELLERQLEEVKESFEKQSQADANDRDQITKQAQMLSATLGDVIQEYQKYSDEMMMEAQEENLEIWIKEFDDNMTQLIRLINRPSMFCRDEAGNRFYFNSEREKVFKAEAHSSEYKLNPDGEREKVKVGIDLSTDENGEFFFDLRGRKIYTKFYFEDEFGRFYIDIHGDRHYKADPEASEYELRNGNWVKVKDGTYATDEQGLRVKPEETASELMSYEGSTRSEESTRSKEKIQDDDLRYIIETVGPAIRKGLAAVVLYHPVDPINYFANFLLQYRSNERKRKYREKAKHGD